MTDAVSALDSRLDELERRDGEATKALGSLVSTLKQLQHQQQHQQQHQDAAKVMWRPPQGPLLADKAFGDVIDRLRRCGGPQLRSEVVKTLAQTAEPISCSQLGRVLDFLPTIAERESALARLARQVADPPNIGTLRPHVSVRVLAVVWILWAKLDLFCYLIHRLSTTGGRARSRFFSPSGTAQARLDGRRDNLPCVFTFWGRSCIIVMPHDERQHGGCCR